MTMPQTANQSQLPVPAMDRRRFLAQASSVALVVGAARLAADDKPAKPKPLFQAVELNHLALDTPQESDTIAFYERHFGMTNISHGRMVRDTFLHFARGFLNTGRAEAAGMNHFCLSIEGFNPDEVYRQLDSLGLRPMRLGGGRLLHVNDPEGINVQIQEIAHGYGRMQAEQLTNAGTGTLESLYIHHVSLRTTDLPRSREFYVEMFGLAPAAGGDDTHCVLNMKQGFVELRKADKAGLDHFCLAVKPFDAGEVRGKLTAAKVELVETGEAGVLAVRDPNGLTVQVLADPAPKA
jgi:catechol 2,3-dioxygenase-like lactoylglutathione lyase family enzyme